jgi:hypothetical protein
MRLFGEMGYIDYNKEDSQRFVRRYPSEFFNSTLHGTWWFADDTSLL